MRDMVWPITTAESYPQNLNANKFSYIRPAADVMISQGLFISEAAGVSGRGCGQ
jgi:hypothetical protein